MQYIPKRLHEVIITSGYTLYYNIYTAGNSICSYLIYIKSRRDELRRGREYWSWQLVFSETGLEDAAEWLMKTAVFFFEKLLRFNVQLFEPPLVIHNTQQDSEA